MRDLRPGPETVPSRAVALPAIGLWELAPRPIACPHDRAGRPHRSLKEVLRCLRRYGVPGFKVEPMEVR